MLITFLIIFATIILFVWNRLWPDLVALLSLLALFVTGVLSSQQALAGFADSTTVMVAALFVVGEGLCPHGGERVAGAATGAQRRQQRTAAAHCHPDRHGPYFGFSQ